MEAAVCSADPAPSMFMRCMRLMAGFLTGGEGSAGGGGGGGGDAVRAAFSSCFRRFSASARVLPIVWKRCA